MNQTNCNTLPHLRMEGGKRRERKEREKGVGEGRGERKT